MSFSSLSMRHFQVIMQMTLHFILLKNHILNQSILKKNFTYLQKWFHDNYMVFNPGKCYYMIFGSYTTKNEFVLEDFTFVPSVDHHVQKQLSDVFCKKGVLRNLAKFTGKHLCRSHNQR